MMLITMELVEVKYCIMQWPLKKALPERLVVSTAKPTDQKNMFSWFKIS